MFLRLLALTLIVAFSSSLFAKVGPGDYVARFGAIYIVSAQENNFLIGQNIQTLVAHKLTPNSISREVTHFEGIVPGDDVILLSTESVRGHVLKLFEDGTTLIRSTDNSFHIGMRARKAKLYTNFGYYLNSEIIDNHHYIGSLEGYFEEDFILFKHDVVCTTNTCTNINLDDTKSRILKVIKPPYDIKDIKVWIVGIAEELNRGDYFHKGLSKAQYAISKRQFQNYFVDDLIDYINRVDQSSFEKLINHIVWKEKNAAKAALNLRYKIKKELRRVKSLR